MSRFGREETWEEQQKRERQERLDWLRQFSDYNAAQSAVRSDRTNPYRSSRGFGGDDGPSLSDEWGWLQQEKQLQAERDKWYKEFINSTKLDDKSASAQRDSTIDKLAAAEYRLRAHVDPDPDPDNRGAPRLVGGGWQSLKEDFYPEWNKAREEFVVADNKAKLEAFQKKAEQQQANAMKAAQEASRKRKEEMNAEAIRAQKAMQEKFARDTAAAANKFNQDFLNVQKGKADRENRSRSAGLLSWLGLTGEQAKDAKAVEKTLLTLGKQQYKENIKSDKEEDQTETGRTSIFDKLKRSLLSEKAGSK